MSPLLDHGLELAPAERGAWLAGIAADDPELARDLRTLLARHEQLDDAGFLAEPLPIAPPPSLAGERCGPYTLVSPIGRGGMGTVWLAERSDGRFTGVAAVKLLNASLLGHDGEARFRREGTILARLHHPHIAQLVDAGVSPQGQPYLILEHVDGRRIDEYCDAAGLDLEARLRLFLDVMAAVSHAHASLVVHRDLKPSNVMVDADGRVKLLDFGIAKLLEGETADTLTALTRDGHSALTPEFAAPEQLSGGAITTATDVYALGVLLYLLLTGRHPTRIGPSPAELVRGIVEIDAPRASHIAGGRFTAALRGDLDAIFEKALRKRPEDRYASVDAMADDVRRYLANEPVSATAGSLAYRARKFVRRHRLGVAAAAAVLLTLAAGTAAVAWQARAAQRERNEALAQLARATATNDFMNVLLNVAAPGGKPISVGELLEHGSRVVDKQFASDPSMRAELLTVIGRTLLQRENLDQARGVLDRASTAARQTGDRAVIARAQCPRAVLLAANGEFKAADAMMAEALAGVPDEPRHALLRAECLIARSLFGYFTDQGEPMIRDAEAALALIDRAGVPARLTRIDALSALAYGHYLAKHTREADAAYARLWTMLEQAGLEQTDLASSTLNNWSLLHFWGDIAKAEALCRRAVALSAAIEGDSVAPTITFNHASTLLLLGRLDEARPLFEAAIASARARKQHRLEFDAIMELSWLHTERGDLDAAERLLATLDPIKDTPRFGQRRHQILDFSRARLALARDDDGALAQWRDVAARFEQHEQKITKAARSLIYLAQAEHRTGHPAEALSAARRAIALAGSFVEPGSPSYLIGLARLAEAEVLSTSGESAKAGEAYRLAADHLRTTLGPAHPATREAGRRAQSTSQEASSPPVRQ